MSSDLRLPLRYQTCHPRAHACPLPPRRILLSTTVAARIVLVVAAFRGKLDLCSSGPGQAQAQLWPVQ